MKTKQSHTSKAIISKIVPLVICLLVLVVRYGHFSIPTFGDSKQDTSTLSVTVSDTSSIPNFNGKDYDIIINDNTPYFTQNDLANHTKEDYGSLDNLGRTGPSSAYISKEDIARDDRGSIGMIKPSGWQTVRYDNVIKDRYLYNRSHLIGYQFIGNSSNVKENLITGTRYFNADEEHGMLHYEMKLREYLNSSNKHVKYRVTPVYKGNNLVASGVLMEAMSVEDNGKDFSMCVFIYNEQPGININHSDGNSSLQ